MIKEVTTGEEKVFVKLCDKIHIGESTLMKEQLLQYLNQGYSQLILNLQEVTEIDSSGLGAFVALHNRAMQNGGGVVITGLTGRVKEIFEATGLIGVFAQK